MNKKKILLIVLLILLILILPGAIYYKIQLYRLAYIHTYFHNLGDDYISSNQKKIDVFNYNLSFDLYPEKKMFIAHAVLTGEVLDNNIESIDLNFYDNFEIKTILLNGVSTEYENDGTKLSIPYNSLVGKEFKIEVHYEGTPKKAGLDGFVFGKRNGESLIYNLSEPTYASTWFPCNDLPFDKTLMEMSITNDSSAISVSNGVLVDIKTIGHRRTYTWKTEYPISTYLIAIYSSDYLSFSDNYISLDGLDTMKVEYYVLPDKFEKAKVDFSSHVKMLEVLSQMFGEYPFLKEKYGVAEFLWFPGAMEHQTITGVSSNMISGKNFFEDTYVHELAHQWWGNAVGPKSWKDIWLNEGFATYSEALYYEAISGKKALQSTMISKYSSNFTGSLAEPGSFLFTRTMYDKGAWVLHMLRWEVGDSSFFNILRNYFETYKYSNASISDFKNICEKVSKKNLTKFFKQWVYSEGQIELEYKTESIKLENNYLVKIPLQQVQEGNEAFYFPLEIKMLYEDNKQQIFRYEIMSRDTILEISMDAMPDSIELDPNRWLLADIFMKDE
ncbi:MAG: M1 family aminopeptidase [Ignavibacteriaceae bacterium]|nr:M1 family aminopeptidase [Ignavibacteriaceae bacterium]